MESRGGSRRCEYYLNFSIDLEEGNYVLITKLVDEVTCNPLKMWLHMGSPSNPTKEQLELLREGARPQIRTQPFVIKNQGTDFEVTLSSNALCYFELKRIVPQADRGYKAERIRGAYEWKYL